MNTNEAVLQITGMKCGECVRRVAESLLGVEGVDDAEVDLETGSARVRLSEGSPASQGDLIKAVDEAGYAVDRIEMP